MATFRVGVGSFNINDGSVGIGTEGSGHGNLKVEGTIKTSDIDVLGVSTFTRYSGFSADNVNINNRHISLSGEYSTTGDVVVEDGASLTVGLGSTACVGTVESISVKNHFSVPVGDTAQRNESAGYDEGTIRYNINLETMEFFNGNEWRQFRYQLDAKNSPSMRGRVLAFGGRNPGRIKSIRSIEIATLGGEVEYFGDLVTAARQLSACSSETRALTMGGSTDANDLINEITYVTMASGGDCIDFGNLQGEKQICNTVSSSTRGVSYGSGGSPYNQIDYVEISTLGNSLDFGDSASADRISAPSNSPIKGFKIAGTGSVNNSKVKEFITFSSTGNGTDFGEAIVGIPGGVGGSNSVRSVTAGGYSIPGSEREKRIEFFNMVSLGESYFFGDLTRKTAGAAVGSCSNSVRGLFVGGYSYPSIVNIIDYITFASTGNAQDFGDLDQPAGQVGTASDAHGGLGGY